MLRQFSPGNYNPDHMWPALFVISLIGTVGLLMLLTVVQ
jgi:hypothetical protein